MVFTSSVCIFLFPNLDAFEEGGKENPVQKKNVNADKKREERIHNVDREDVGAAHEGFTSSTFQQSLAQKGFVSGLRLKNRAAAALSHPLRRAVIFLSPQWQS